MSVTERVSFLSKQTNKRIHCFGCFCPAEYAETNQWEPAGAVQFESQTDFDKELMADMWATMAHI